MATLPKVLINRADYQIGGGLRTQAASRTVPASKSVGIANLATNKLHIGRRGVLRLGSSADVVATRSSRVYDCRFHYPILCQCRRLTGLHESPGSRKNPRDGGDRSRRRARPQRLCDHGGYECSAPDDQAHQPEGRLRLRPFADPRTLDGRPLCSHMWDTVLCEPMPEYRRFLSNAK
jgi:hypothetical protein